MRTTMEQYRESLVAELRRQGIPLSPAVEQAFLRVPRHLFVPGVAADVVYSDREIVTKRDKEGVPISASNRPSTMAVLLEALAPQEGHRILEIGAGTGYNAAIMAEITGPGGAVTTIEYDDEIAEGAKAHLERAGYTEVDVIHADGALGYAANAPYDRIVSTTSVWDLPPDWVAQLKDDGLLVTALYFGGYQIGVVLRKMADGSLQSQQLVPLEFIPIQGQAAGPEVHSRLPGSTLCVDFMEGDDLGAARIHTLLSADHELAQFPVELERYNLGLFSYYLLFYQPEGYHFVTYHVESGQLAYGLEGYGWGILSATSACLVPHGNERVVHTYGAGDAYLTLLQLAEQWKAAGQPGLETCHLHITPAGRKPALPDDRSQAVRVFARPTHTYVLWMETP